jgi:hypothetical protein
MSIGTEADPPLAVAAVELPFPDDEAFQVIKDDLDTAYYRPDNEIFVHGYATVRVIQNKYSGSFELRNNGRDHVSGSMVSFKGERLYSMNLVAGWSDDAMGVKLYLKSHVLEGLLSGIVDSVTENGTVEEADALAAMLLDLRDELVASRRYKAQLKG